jgi:hypothetical protein
MRTSISDLFDSAVRVPPLTRQTTYSSLPTSPRLGPLDFGIKPKELEKVLNEIKPGLSIWELLKDEAGADDWDGWVVEGKWCVDSTDALRAGNG